MEITHSMNGMIAWFPGQGSQYVGMAKELLDSFKVARETFEEASDAADLNLRKLCLYGPEAELMKTEYTQPALLTASIAAFRVAQTETGFTPAVAAGHSLGEYSALVAAGALPLSVAARWVRERGGAMQRAVPPGEGTMAAILGLSDDTVGKLCQQASEEARISRPTSAEYSHLTVEPIVQPANFNAPHQVVIAGSADGIAHALRLIKESADFKGGKAVPLAVSAPFHCRLMAPARAHMADLFSQGGTATQPRELAFPYLPNRTGRISRESSLILELLIEQIDHPVLWRQTVEHLHAAGFKKAVEFGPGKVLQNLAKRIPGEDETTILAVGVSDVATLKAFEALQ